ncbi:MAG: response regulator [Desulfobacteraceae bacterium]|nr:MAG: response regulator [Desulfobacteraceae bacterium]
MQLQKVKDTAMERPVRKDRILIVDDDSSTRELVSKMVSLYDYDAFPAEDAFKALDILDQMSFDVVITDLQMPGMDGWELAKKIKERTEDIPVILMTGANEEMVRGKIGRSSVDVVIFKPFGLKEIQEAIEDTFELRIGLTTLRQAQDSGSAGNGAKQRVRSC